MSAASPPAVQRVTPPKAPYRVVNPVMAWLLSSPRRAGRIGRHLLLLHVTGRRTGRTLSVPVAYHREDDGRLLLLTNSGWRVNLRGGPTPVEVTVLGQRSAATATLVEQPDAVARVYQRLLEELGYEKAGRRLGIRISVERVPTLDELADAARRDHLSLVYVEMSSGTP